MRIVEKTTEQGALDVAGLTVTLSTPSGEVRPVQEATLTVRPGEKVALVGETGCGKSVLLKSLVQLLPPKVFKSIEGSVQITGSELVGASARQLASARRSEIGVVFQDASTYLNPTMRIGRQVAEAVPGNKSSRAKGSVVESIFSSVGLPSSREFRSRYPHELSGGMRQRVMIAVALAKDPKVLLADEPTTALDVTVQAGILSTLNDLVESTAMGLLIVTHDLGVVAELCDRIYVMYAGQVVEEGDVRSIFSDPRHPYTRRLLECVLDVSEPGELRSIPGSVPSPYNFPNGCRFRARCDRAMDICAEEPPMAETTSGKVKCWLEVPEVPQTESTTTVGRGNDE